MLNAQRLRMAAAAAFILAGGWVCAPQANAEESFPSKPVTVVVPWAPGGGVDVTTRFFASKGEKYLKVPVIVENKPGASGVIGISAVNKAAPDGYTLVATTQGGFTMSQWVNNIDYAPEAFEPVLVQGETVMFLVAGPKAPATDFEGMVNYIRENPGKVTIACGGTADVSGLQVANLFKSMGLEIKLVPFKGAAESAANAMGGHVMYANVADSVAAPNLKSGHLKPICTFSVTRSGHFPEIPTLSELGQPQGVFPYYKVLMAPPKTPEAVLSVLREGFAKMLRDPEVLALYDKAQISLQDIVTDPETIRQMLARDRERDAKLVEQFDLSKK